MTAAAAVTVATGIAAGAGPAYAKSDTMLSGPRVVLPGHAFHLVVWVGDDAGARPASARLQLRDGRGRYHWVGPWQRLRLAGQPDQEAYTFTMVMRHHGRDTFRTVVSNGYAASNAVTVTVR